MNVKRWVGRQESQWQQLEVLLSRAECQGLKALSAREVQQLSSLYRLVAADLSRARTRQVGVAVTEQLQGLATRSYAQIYQGGRRQNWQAMVDFISWGFPGAVQQAMGAVAIATTIFLLGAAVGWWYTWRDPAFMQLVVPSGIIELVQDKGQLWMGSIVGMEPLASSAIMRNNISVTFTTFAGGMLGGLGTLFVLWNNGLHIGAIATLVGQNNLAYPFWAFVFPHGALELPAIFLAGGAGLLLAQGILFPGRYGRLEALKGAGNQAILLMFGVVPMLVIAGIIEGFFSPAPQIPDSLKYLVGLLLLLGLVLYLNRQPPPPSA
ncbi:stage II sporulation protein M [Synechococcales cyanobacterium C]|uniref:Stage II sporulation protein M n=1 Tax=Petrachloros mirabilis ULC683 TaxID=2781853 RepID=A0A8K1ZXH6_9CYAN|nr:stage II sporulation protein M [Petrachloros mirabilis]NCJ05881.1 stage II sporulation protein M [Petrachloros mirabilis ULC683]